MSEFPKMLYKAGTAFEWEGKRLDSLVVADAVAQETAFGGGWLAADMLNDDAPNIVAPAVDTPRRGRPRKDA